MEVELHVRTDTTLTWAEWLCHSRYRFDLPDALGERASAAWRELKAVQAELEAYLGVSLLDDESARRVVMEGQPKTGEWQRYEDEIREQLRALAPPAAPTLPTRKAPND